jgi:hypothetical protein
VICRVGTGEVGGDLKPFCVKMHFTFNLSTEYYFVDKAAGGNACFLCISYFV